jgi:putative spermidine/putrescine transport system substrate-binding protein
LAACTGNELLTDEGCAINGEGNFDQIHFWKTPVADCATQDACVPYSEWVTSYLAVIGG